jgi:hypothetical protein
MMNLMTLPAAGIVCPFHKTGIAKYMGIIKIPSDVQ